MEIEDGFYWCETPDTQGICKTKAETIEYIEDRVEDTDGVSVWHLSKISSENFHWEEVTWEELMDAHLSE